MGLRGLMSNWFEVRRLVGASVRSGCVFGMPLLALVLTVSACTKYRVASSDGGDASENDSSSGTGGSGVGGMAVADGGAAGHGAGGAGGAGGSGAGGSGNGGSATGGSGAGGGGSGTGGAGSVCNNGSSDTCGHVLGAVGTCAAGTTTCSAGMWGPCSIQPKAADTCDIGNDDSCDGTPNAGCICDGFSPPADHPNPADYDTSTAGIVIDKATGRMWERNPPSTTYTQPAAAAYCAANRLGGFSNWRLPTVIELVSILDFSVTTPSLINSTVFLNTVGIYYWTSTLLAGDATRAWALKFSTGEVQQPLASLAYQVRCVR